MYSQIQLSENKIVIPRRRWADENVATLKILYPTPVAIEVIATKLERSKGSIYNKARRLNLRRPPKGWKPPEADFPALLGCGLPPTDPVAAVRACAALTGEQVSTEMMSPARPRSIRSKLGGNISTWFPDVVERLERLWLADVHHTTIAAILPDGISPAAVQAKAYRIGLPRRHGLTLSKDSEAAREIDRRAAPLAERIRDKSGQLLQRRPCTLTGVWFYSTGNRRSRQAHQTLAGRASGEMFGGLYA